MAKYIHRELYIARVFGMINDVRIAAVNIQQATEIARQTSAAATSWNSANVQSIEHIGEIRVGVEETENGNNG